MSLNGIIRSIEAAHRRSVKQAEFERKLARRRADLSQAAAEVEDHNDLIEFLTGIGRDCGDPIDWHEEANVPEPLAPHLQTTREVRAMEEFTSYVPSFMEKTFGSPHKRKEELARAVEEARATDYQDYLNAHERYTQEWQIWKDRKELADRVVGGELEVYRQIIQEIGPFRSLKNIASEFCFNFKGMDRCVIEVDVKSENVVPDEIKALTSTGKLTRKPMLESRKWEIYQDYVCGCMFRAAREIFSLLPVRLIISSAHCVRVNPMNGRHERMCIGAVGIHRDSLGHINFKHVDFSEAMKAFIHRMDFSKRAGFDAVDVLSLDDFSELAN